MTEMRGIEDEITENYEAIFMALAAIGYMLRKDYEAALVLHIASYPKPSRPAFDEMILSNACSIPRGNMRYAREKLGEILEAVAECRRHSGAVQEAEANFTAPAFEAMRKAAAGPGEKPPEGATGVAGT